MGWSTRRLAARALPLLGLLTLAAGLAHAQSTVEYPPKTDITNWLTDSMTGDNVGVIAREVSGNFWFITLIFLPYIILPQAILLYSIFRFKARKGVRPATFHENVPLEVAWTVIPALTLIVAAVSSYKVIKLMETPPPADVRVDIIGQRFQWQYRYPEYDITIADEPLVIPVNANVVATVTSIDVIHAFWVPAFAVKIDAVPGRINELWWNADQTGWYKGQCAELCGALHAAMYIDVVVLEQDQFNQWVRERRGSATAIEAVPAEGDLKEVGSPDDPLIRDQDQATPTEALVSPETSSYQGDVVEEAKDAATENEEGSENPSAEAETTEPQQ